MATAVVDLVNPSAFPGSGELVSDVLIAPTVVAFGAFSASFDVAPTAGCAGVSVSATFGNSWDGGNVEITGITVRGDLVTEVIRHVVGGSAQTANAFARVLRVRNTARRTNGLVTLTAGTRFGLTRIPREIVAVYRGAAPIPVGTGASQVSVNLSTGVFTLGGSLTFTGADIQVFYRL